ncbi:Cellulose synthase-like protein G2 [Acorus gramineus]|uniref:Cellulose synthase-like protein G2 n=1 Tax=Acorus gramineus TaxID=55184 RepID=A0AAV9B455_ACOGR|nr:Cellulose synthase-like protein G2 [Acorus gramineus]
MGGRRKDHSKLHSITVEQPLTTINRAHSTLHLLGVLAVLYYRSSWLLLNIPTVPFSLAFTWSLMFASELVLAFTWLINQSFRWRVVSRSAFPERLPNDDEQLPAIDVFVCTVDPEKEPTIEVMNTVISAMCLDYPVEKMSVYLSDDGGSPLTLYAAREAYEFARSWNPFCRKYKIETRSPEAYFSSCSPSSTAVDGTEFVQEQRRMKVIYETFKMNVGQKRRELTEAESSQALSKKAEEHPPLVQIIHDEKGATDEEHCALPLLVYVSREKRKTHPHHFKAGALNVLLRVSSIMSNSSYILALDCDMHCNDPTSARQAMCFHLDTKISSSLAFVQFPQSFYNMSTNDIYHSFPNKSFKIGFMYGSVVEDFLTGFLMQCKGWRWGAGLLEVAFSKFCPLIYGLSHNISFLQRMCYAALAFQPINAFPVLCYSLIPQLCLINGISLFPSVSTKWFLIFGAVHLSWMCQNLREEFVIGGTIKTWWKEERMRKMRCITSDLLACFDFTMKCVGAKQIKFLLTNKVVDEKKLQMYEKGIFDFEGSTVVLIPASTIAILSTITFLGGLVKVIMQESYGAMIGQLYISFFSMMSGYPILEGILIRKDKGKVPVAITLYSAVWAMFILIIFYRW